MKRPADTTARHVPGEHVVWWHDGAPVFARVVATCRDAACIDFAAPFDGYVMATVWRPTATGYDVQEETLEVFQ